MMRPSDTFTWRERPLVYETGEYNRAAENERAIEVPIAVEFLRSVAPRPRSVLEVGNVLSHYHVVDHDIVDLHEQAPHVRNVDLFDVAGQWDAIVAISTVEHVRWGTEGVGLEPTQWDPLGAIEAIEHLRRLLAPGGSLLVTVPLGQNPYLDGAILGGGLQPERRETFTFEGDHWLESPVRVWRPVRRRNWPGAVWIGTWRREP